ncbi:MAG: lytic murein transglycosylase [Candidatus Nealsonbacteria bacterium]|nr:lytic murein transglycosylase [Candidatus Nealsonbacteria bacterium]
MSNYLFKIILLVALISAFVSPKFFALALTPTEERQALEEELKQLEEQIAQYEKDITKTEQEKKTLVNQISILQNTIKKLDLQIYQSNIVINDLGVQIKDTESSIKKTSLNIEDGKERLGAILREIYQEDRRSLIEILLSEGISDFFDNLVALEEVNAKNKDLLTNIKALKVYLEDEKLSLDEEKGGLEKQVVIQNLQKQENTKKKLEQDYLLKMTEAEYQKQLEEKESVEKIAQAIRERIFELIGVPEAPTFGQALVIAKVVSGLTGVRPAFLLAVLTQESNIGSNVGQCYLKDATTGDGVRVNGTFIPKVMKPSRDVQPFLQITETLGRDPFNTPVSCPIPSLGGYGGAMGPAQFIPSTWMMYKNRVAELKGSPADPWNISDAFLAAAVYLADAGATKKTHDYEWCAALSYFAGSCSLSKQIRYEFYGDSVMAIAARYEQDIKEID